MAGGGCVWHGGHVLQGCAWQGACMAGGCMAGGVHDREACVAEGACMAGGGHAWQGRHAWQGACVAGEMTTAVDGMHPTGMHSCCC